MKFKGNTRENENVRNHLTNEDDEISTFLDNAFKFEIFVFVENNQEKFSLKPLEFVKYLLSTFEFVFTNRQQPYKSYLYIKNLPELKTDFEAHYFGEKLDALLDLEAPARNYLELLIKESNKAEIILDSEISAGIKQYEVSKILQIFIDSPDYPNFKYKKFRQLSIESLQVTLEILKREMQTQAIDVKAKHKDLTLNRATLAFNYFLTYAKVNVHNTKKAEFIAFLTGFSQKTIRQELSKLHNKSDLNFVSYEKDMQIVRKYFEILDLDEIVKMIDNDLAA